MFIRFEVIDGLVGNFFVITKPLDFLSIHSLCVELFQTKVVM